MELWIVQKRVYTSGLLAPKGKKLDGPFFEREAAERRLTSAYITDQAKPGYQIVVLNLYANGGIKP